MTQNPNTAPEPVEHHILVVSPDSAWSKVVTRALKDTGVSRETAPNADAAIDRFTQEDGEPVTSVVTDGLRGNWRRVVEAAMEVGVTPVMMTKSALSRQSAAEMGIPVFAKQRVASSSLERARFVQAVMPGQKRK